VPAMALSVFGACGSRTGLPTPTEREAPSCPADTPHDPANCGRCGHDCCGGECQDGVCQPVMIASGRDGPIDVAVDESRVVWTEFAPGRPGRILSCPKSGCIGSPAVLVQQGAPEIVVLGGGTMFWVDGQGEKGDRRILRCDGDCAQPPTVIASGLSNPENLAIDERHVYWTDLVDETVLACPLDGCAGAPTVLTSGENNVSGIAVDATSLYYGAYTQVAKCPLDGCAHGRMVLASTVDRSPWGTSIATPSAIAVDPTTVYWIDYVGGTVARCALAGCGGQGTALYVTNQSEYPIDIAIDDTIVYWPTERAGTVLACDKAGCGGRPHVLASGQGHPLHIALDERCVYWTNSKSGEVMKVAKP